MDMPLLDEMPSRGGMWRREALLRPNHHLTGGTQIICKTVYKQLSLLGGGDLEKAEPATGPWYRESLPSALSGNGRVGSEQEGFPIKIWYLFSCGWRRGRIQTSDEQRCLKRALKTLTHTPWPGTVSLLLMFLVHPEPEEIVLEGHYVRNTGKHVCVFPQGQDLLTSINFTKYGGSVGNNFLDSPTFLANHG